MKSTIRRADALEELHMSPITPSGQVVFSSIRKVSDPNDPTKEYIETTTPESNDAITVLALLDTMNGIGWTSELQRIEKELRAALRDFMGAR